MTKADQIRALAAEGLKAAEIASRLGIRYQHAYNVMNAGPRKTLEVETKPSITTRVKTISHAQACPHDRDPAQGWCIVRSSV